MVRVALLIFSVIATSLMGIAIVVVLTAGYGTLMPILYAALVGFLVALPVTWVIAKKIDPTR